MNTFETERALFIISTCHNLKQKNRKLLDAISKAFSNEGVSLVIKNNRNLIHSPSGLDIDKPLTFRHKLITMRQELGEEEIIVSTEYA